MNQDAPSASRTASVYLVSHSQTLPPTLPALPEYPLHLIAPSQILTLSAQAQSDLLRGAKALLFDWGEESTAVLMALSGAARKLAVPLIALCSPQEAEQVAALVIGADQVLVRPLNPVLLQARLVAYERLTNRSSIVEQAGDGVSSSALPLLQLPPTPTHEVITVGPLRLDHTAHHFFVHDHQVRLTQREFGIMSLLMQQVDICHTRDEILTTVWELDFDTETNILDVQIYNLRRKLKKHQVDGMLETVRGVGFRLVLLEDHVPVDQGA